MQTLGRKVIVIFLLLTLPAPVAYAGMGNLYSSREECVGSLNNEWTEWSYDVASPIKEDRIYKLVTNRQRNEVLPGPVAWLEGADETRVARGLGNTQLKDVRILGEDRVGPVKIVARFGSPDSEWVPRFYGRVVNLSRGTKFLIDDIDFRFHLEANLDDEYMGQIQFGVKTESLNWGFRSGSFSGSRLFSLMIEYFEEYAPANIVGKWIGGSNLSAYIRARERGVEKAAAAAETWTARQAMVHGFSNIKVLKELRDQNDKITRVTVDFSK